MIGFSGRKFYTLKVHALRLFLVTIKQYKCINLGPFLFNYTKKLWFKSKITLGVCKFWTSTQIMQEKNVFSWKNYTAGQNFTRLPVVTVATNLNSAFTITIISRIKGGESCGASEWDSWKDRRGFVALLPGDKRLLGRNLGDIVDMETVMMGKCNQGIMKKI